MECSKVKPEILVLWGDSLNFPPPSLTPPPPPTLLFGGQPAHMRMVKVRENICVCVCVCGRTASLRGSPSSRTSYRARRTASGISLHRYTTVCHRVGWVDLKCLNLLTKKTLKPYNWLHLWCLRDFLFKRISHFKWIFSPFT